MPACSKNKDKDKDNNTAEKTVDLGETDDNAKAADDNQDKPRRNRSGNANRSRNNKDNAKPAKDSQDDKAAPPDPPKEDDAKEAPAEAANNEANGFDFSDDAQKPPAEPRIPKPRIGLSIEKLINIRELREQTNYAGALSEAYLQGQVPEPRYNAMRLAPDDASKLGFAIQVWKPGNESAASKRFNDLFTQSFGGQKIRGVATDAFTASHHKLNELAFFDKSKRSTVLMSCSDDICSIEQLKSIAQIIQKRL
jgi:hypothetical protein